MAGNRTASYRARHLRRRVGAGRGGRRTAASAQDKRLARLVICGVLFVLLVAVKLLFPEAVGRLARSAGELIGRDADFKEAFAAMGRAAGGKEEVGDSLHQAYTAVFGPSDDVEDPDLEAAAGPRAGDGAVPDPVTEAMPLPVKEKTSEDLPASAPAESEEKSVVEREIDLTEPEEDTVTASASYVYTMPALPENASLEQRSLGFDYASPVVAPLSSSFGWREHPVTGGQKFHYGVDLAADYGSDVCAFAGGMVYATGESSTLGKYIMLQHEGGYITLYGHLSEVTVSGGDVALGDKIAEVGDTGMVTGAHLHFELHSGELYLNPIYYVELG